MVIDGHVRGLGLNCTPPAIDDFPRDFFTEEQRKNGAIVVHVLVSLYLFVALAVVCDKFFVPAVERICKALNMSNDVAGATFMAAATSAPELFVNVIGTFITEGDIGVGTIVGSAVFNILAVAACCGIGAGMSGVKVVQLDWWPLTRDCIAYGFTVAMLICVIHDERIEWYEALILVLLYFIYIGFMYYDKNLQTCFRRIEEDKPDKSLRIQEISVQSQSVEASDVHLQLHMEHLETTDQSPEALPLTRSNTNHQNGSIKKDFEKTFDNEKSVEENLSKKEHTYKTIEMCLKKVAWLLTWPIHLVFSITIPDCDKPKLKHLFPFTFVMCIVWIGSLSYVIAWMITVVGDTLRIPDSVMGITFLAAGTSVPEAVSSVIVSKQGYGSMGISNSIGSNTFDILLCLGLPWFFKAAFSPTVPGNHWVGINSSGLEYNAISLLSTLFLLYLTFAINKFKLDKAVGRTCLLMYAVFLILATLIELNVFFPVNLPTCGR